MTVLLRGKFAGVRAVAWGGVLMLGALSLLPLQASAASLHVTGHLGFIGEWELSANLTGSESNGRREFSGPLSLKHVGLCTHDGPEEKTGRMRLDLSASSSRVTATFLLQGVACTYSARKSAAYDGVLLCPDQSPIPLSLELDERTVAAAKSDGQKSLTADP